VPNDPHASGIQSVTFARFTVRADSGQAGIMGFKGMDWGHVTLRNLHFGTNSGLKWAIRSEGTGGWRVVRCTGEGGQEHFFYVDNAQGIHFINNFAKDYRRTMFQAVTRYASSDGNPHRRGPSGDLFLEGNEALNIGGPNSSDGGAAFTVAGHPVGSVDMIDNEVYSQWTNCGAVAVYGDNKIVQLRDPTNPRDPSTHAVGLGFIIPDPTDPDGRRGWANRKVRVTKLTAVFPNGLDRNAVAIDSVQEGFDLTEGGRYSGQIETSKQGVHIEHRGTGVLMRGAPGTKGWGTKEVADWRFLSKDHPDKLPWLCGQGNFWRDDQPLSSSEVEAVWSTQRA
jgi:hypothetical protein